MANRRFAIITDSGCDMPEKYLKEKNIDCVKLGFTMNNINYEGEGGEKITEKEFYQKLRDGAMPTTYQVTCEMAKNALEKHLQAGKDTLVICFSSGLSGTADSFKVAGRELAKKYPERKICIVDSLCASMGEGLLLDYAVEKADTGASIEETAKFTEDLKGKIRHFFTVDNLYHLKRGGRVSTATAIVGSILKIKPIMKVDEQGKLIVIGKTMGRKKALHAIVERLIESMDESADRIFISHGDCLDEAKQVQELLVRRLPNIPVTIHFVGTVIGSHSGAGTLALFVKGK
jgi:DegV family protein with EDD domain